LFAVRILAAGVCMEWYTRYSGRNGVAGPVGRAGRRHKSSGAAVPSRGAPRRTAPRRRAAPCTATQLD